jgi:hypothetical protein
MKVLSSFRIASKDWARISMAPDGTKLVVRWREGETMRTVLDGRPLPEVWWKRGGPPEQEWARNNRRAVWLIREGGNVYVGDSEGTCRGPYSDVRFGASCFSDEGRRLTYGFQREGESEWHVQVDDAEFGPYDVLYGPGFSVDLAKWAFQQRNGPWFLHVENDEYGPFVNQPILVTVTPDARVAFILKRTDDYVIHVADREFGPYVGERPKFQLSPAGDRLAIAYFSNGKWNVVLDGASVGSFGEIYSLDGFSPDGKRFGFGFRDGARGGYWLDGERRDGLPLTVGPHWSADSRHVAWGIDLGKGRHCIDVDGVTQALGARVDWESGGEFTFAPDGRFCLVLYDPKRDTRSIRLGNALYDVESACLSSHTKRCVLFSRDGSTFALGGSYGASGGYVEWTGGRVGPFDVFDYALTPDGELIVAALDEASLEVRHMSARL